MFYINRFTWELRGKNRAKTGQKHGTETWDRNMGQKHENRNIGQKLGT